MSAAAYAQVPDASYEVRRGDTLYEIARKTRHEGVSTGQMAQAIARANPGAFPGGNLNLLRPGQVLTIPAAAVVARPAPPARPAAAKRYSEGLALERQDDEKGAFAAFLEAGEAGHGLAQRKLGQIYDRGNSAVERDYETALKWFEKARAQGVPIPKPFVRSPR